MYSHAHWLGEGDVLTGFSVFQFSQVSIDEPLFQPFPSTIYFQNFEPFETYEVPLSLRNNDKVPV